MRWEFIAALSIIFVAAAAFLCMYYGVPFLVRLENRNSWMCSIDGTTVNVINAFAAGEYESAAYMIRQAKLEAEHLDILPEEYSEFLDKVRKELPSTIEKDRLPYDLKEENRDHILFGLCVTGTRRLTGVDRETELLRIAEEIRSARNRNDQWAFDAYWEKLENRSTPEGITANDMSLIKEYLRRESPVEGD